MQQFSKGPIFIALTIVVSLSAIVWAYQYRKGETQVSYQSVTASTSPLVVLTKNISDDEWQKLLERTNDEATTTEELNVSTTISREVMAQFALALEQGRQITPADAKEIAAAMVEYADATEEKPVFYTSSNIKKISNPTIDELRTFYTLFQATLSKIPPNVGNELVIMQEAIVDNNLANIKSLEAVSAFYKQMAKDLSQISVPQPIANDYLQFVNFYITLSKNVKAFAQFQTDPIIAAKNFNEYTTVYLETQNVYPRIQTYLESQGVDL